MAILLFFGLAKGKVQGVTQVPEVVNYLTLRVSER